MLNNCMQSWNIRGPTLKTYKNLNIHYGHNLAIHMYNSANEDKCTWLAGNEDAADFGGKPKFGGKLCKLVAFAGRCKGGAAERIPPVHRYIVATVHPYPVELPSWTSNIMIFYWLIANCLQQLFIAGFYVKRLKLI